MLSREEIAPARGEDDAPHVRFDVFLVEEDTAAVAACVLGVVEGLVGAGEKRACDFALGGLGDPDADGERQPGTRYGELLHRLLDPTGDGQGV